MITDQIRSTVYLIDPVEVNDLRLWAVPAVWKLWAA